MILLTGSDGFIGKNLISKLQDVICLERENCFDILSNLDWRSITYIYHLGAISDTTETNIELIYRYNIDFSLKLFEYAIHYQIPITYASSASVYGNSRDYQINPLNYYALSKATIDLWVLDNINRFNNVIGLRYFNVYGPQEEHKGNQASPVHQFSKQAELTGKIKLFEGSENYKRDFVCVKDVVDCTLDRRPSGIYDVGTNKPASFKYVAELIATKYNAVVETVPFPNNLQNKYQIYTQARNHYDRQFITIEDYLNGKI